MKIICNETGKTYTLTMTTWTGSDWDGPDESLDTILDDSFRWDDTAEAYYMDGHMEDLERYLQDWENYDTESDADIWDADEREARREEFPRCYDLEEIKG